VADLEAAWARHWSGRPGASPRGALRELMEALEEWPRWVKRYGASGAELRLELYQKAVFNLVGEEAWVVFGEWTPTDGEGDHESQTGLLVLLRGDTPLKARVGPLADLLLEDWRIERTQWRGVELFEYVDRRLSRSVTFCQVGGWLCASWRRQGPGPLPILIDRMRRAGEERAEGRSNFPEFWPSVDPLEPQPALAALLYPGRFWGQLRRFNFQRGKAMSEASELRLANWQQRLDGVERVSLTGRGPSLFNVRATLTGPRATLLQTQMNLRMEPSPFGGSSTGETPPGPPVEDAVAASLVAQADLALPLAQTLAPLAGHAWDELLDDAAGLEPWAPGLIDTLRPVFAAGDGATGEGTSGEGGGPQNGRIGMALFRSGVPLYPKVLFWVDRPPQALSMAAPALTWASTRAVDSATTGDVARWFASTAPAGATTSTLGASEAIRAAGEFWRQTPFPPSAFVTVTFPPLAEDLGLVPAALLGDDAGRDVARARRVLRALQLAVGSGLALRLDLTPTQWILLTRPL
jgi:hypothetical protein